ncbi:hypothetical protein CCM_00064 [Cordyceps militaris CM01]|uniref:Uncharacterized protein n=1 Tax=Cordyceps militaris (strain CM01) TaxID=983644 RepID=G3J6T2_CORMM|nr:uncharacterized protein CCM_00064 [Cordyceps militaris CM01]EGX95410.1 hypothetical protein CCM_00064 [Cordyceps militaris CM01]
MASLPQQRAATRLSHESSRSKIRGRTIVKPILKKLNSHSTSDRGSFDLDPGWDDLPSPSADHDFLYSDATPAPHGDLFRPRDVSFSTAASLEYSTSTWRSKNKYSHMRSTSGTSHTSSIATNVSARNGTFVHPCQQTPMTATPSLSYANSIASLDLSAPGPREYASTITEDDDLISPTTTTVPRAATPTAPTITIHALNSRLRGPSLDESQHTLALTDRYLSRPALTSRSNSATTAMYVPAPSSSEFAMSSTPPLLMAPISTSMSSSGTPTSSSPLSPLRNSLDLSGFRLRSRSEVDTRTHQEQVRAARRQFQEKEKAKDEKYARKQLRRRERTDNSRERAKIRKGTNSTSTAKSSATSIRCSASYVNDDCCQDHEPDFANTGAYDHAAAGQAPARADEVQFQRPPRRKSAKHKTNGAWTTFVLWLRTRLLRLGKH